MNEAVSKLREAVTLSRKLAELVEDERISRSLRELADQLQAMIDRLDSKMRSGK